MHVFSQVCLVQVHSVSVSLGTYGLCVPDFGDFSGVGQMLDCQWFPRVSENHDQMESNGSVTSATKPGQAQTLMVDSSSLEFLVPC